MGHERLGHPTQKPVKILKHIVEIASHSGDMVLDPFMGVASTGKATLDLGRNFIGFEIDENYYKKACQRLKESSLPLSASKADGTISPFL